MSFDRSEDRVALFGTVTFHVVLLLLVILMMMKCNNDISEDMGEQGVTVIIGRPDAGADDVGASAEQAQPVEETPVSQETSDIEEAPSVPTTTPTPTTRPTTTPTTTPTETTPEPRRPDNRALFPGSRSGGGSGGGNTGGDRGDPNGAPDGAPDGANGAGTEGTGPDKDGISGSIGGFKVAVKVPPRSGVQKEGAVRLRVCVDANGNVISSSIRPEPGRGTSDGLAYTTDVALVQRATEAMRKFKFTNTSGASGGCGHFTFHFKLN